MTRAEAERRCSEIADSRTALAERPTPPRWYYPAYGVWVGGMIAWAARVPPRARQARARRAPARRATVWLAPALLLCGNQKRGHRVRCTHAA